MLSFIFKYFYVKPLYLVIKCFCLSYSEYCFLKMYKNQNSPDVVNEKLGIFTCSYTMQSFTVGAVLLLLLSSLYHRESSYHMRCV